MVIASTHATLQLDKLLLKSYLSREQYAFDNTVCKTTVILRILWFAKTLMARQIGHNLAACSQGSNEHSSIVLDNVLVLESFICANDGLVYGRIHVTWPR